MSSAKRDPAPALFFGFLRAIQAGLDQPSCLGRSAIEPAAGGLAERHRALAGWVWPVLFPGGVGSGPEAERGFGAHPAASSRPAKTVGKAPPQYPPEDDIEG